MKAQSIEIQLRRLSHSDKNQSMNSIQSTTMRKGRDKVIPILKNKSSKWNSRRQQIADGSGNDHHRDRDHDQHYKESCENGKPDDSKSRKRPLSQLLSKVQTVHFAQPDKLENVIFYDSTCVATNDDIDGRKKPRHYQNSNVPIVRTSPNNSCTQGATPNTKSSLTATTGEAAQNTGNPTRRLCDLALNHSLNEMIQCLQSGEISTQAPCSSLNESSSKTASVFVKERIESLDQERRAAKSISMHSAIKRSIDDLQQKRKVLKIFSTAEVAIDFARSWRETKLFQIRITNYFELNYTDLGKDTDFNHEVFCYFYLDNNPRGRSVWNGRHWQSDDSAGFRASFNPLTDIKYRPGREVRFDFYRESRTMRNLVKLGSIVKTVKDIYNVGPRESNGNDGVNTVSATWELEPTEYFKAGELGIEIIAKCWDDDFTKKKRKECTRMIADVISWITNYRKETKSQLITYDMTYFDQSLLHAAVQMYDASLARRLVSNGSSHIESALNLAVSLQATRHCTILSKYFDNVISLLRENLPDEPEWIDI